MDPFKGALVDPFKGVTEEPRLGVGDPGFPLKPQGLTPQRTNPKGPKDPIIRYSGLG